MAIAFLNNVTSMLFEIPISSPTSKQRAVLVVAIVLIGVAGLYAIIVGAWSSQTWYFFAASCFFFGIFLWVYQTAKEYTLLFSSILMILVAVACYLLASGSAHDSPKRLILTNLVGAAEGWAWIWALYVIGQVFIYKFNMSRKSQNISFFIAAIVLILVRLFMPAFNGHVKIVDFIGFLIMTIALLILMFTEQRKSVFT